MKRIIIILCVLFSAFYSYAQVYTNSEADKIVKGSKLVTIDENSNSIKHICFTASGTGQQFLQDGKEFLKSALSLPPDFGFIELNTTKDNFGTQVKYQFTYNGIPIEDYIYGIQKEDNRIVSANGYYKILKENISGKMGEISEEEAFENALNYVKAKAYQWEIDKNFSKPQGEIYYLEKNRSLILVYRFDIYAAVPLIRQYIYINAITGEVEKTVDRIQIYTNNTGTAVTKYQGTKTIKTDYNASTYRLRENTRGNGIETYDLNNGTSYGSAVDFTDADNYWNTTTNQDDAANDAHYGAEATYDYYLTKFGRNSIDGSGFALKSYVHYSSGYVNAYWDGSCMTYGDGDGSSYTALTSIDVCGHEITHGLTSHTSNLNYSYESGALNESFSDIFGVAIDFYANPTTANYLMGDQISVSRTPFRSMINPNLYSQPDTYHGTYWYTSSGDNGGVHYNSGVQNYWFYLLCEGGSGINDIGNTFSVTPIGMNKASAIAYKTLTVYLTPTSQYADARYYSIQSAIDLYGECSAEVINVTNAWYAVGVGAAYSNAVIANYSVSQNYFCSYPATVQFTNKSVNATTYLWDFGDGSTSTLLNPSHTYNSTGNYTVTLISSGTSLCNSSDTLVSSNPIIVTNTGGPISPSCTPATVNSTGLYGIINFSFNGVANSTPGSSDGYKDYTCQFSSTIKEGFTYNYSISTGTSSLSMVKLWIDLNNDGQFNNTTELLVNASNVATTKSGIINIPHSTVFNTPLRLRIASDMNSSSYLTTACTNSQYGQYEDYSVIIQQNTLPPVAKFAASSTSVNIGQSVAFTDSSLNLPTSWIWTFPGGTPSTSTVQNPAVTYNALGTYSAQLKVLNSYGQDSIIKTSYIHVVNTFNMCTTTSTTSTSGILYDSGGPSGNYQNSENCSFLIDPGCASSITLSFVSFNVESGWDYFRVYNGTNSSGTLLLSATGTTLPGSVTATSGKMYITFTTDGSVTYSGFQATWTSVVPPSNPPVADFSISDSNPPLNTEVQFTDLSTNTPNVWLWNFGDGITSTLKNPTHSYSTSGSKTVTLSASNCYGSGSNSKSVIVQGAPEINLSTTSFNEVINSCDDSISKTLYIKNKGTGNLNWNWPGFISTISDDFDPGVDNAIWQNITGGVAANTCGYFSAPNSLYFNESSTRQAITKPINTTAGGTICFYLEISSGSAPCEMADAGENVILSYSTNGGNTWSDIRTYLPGSYNTFTSISEIIPVSARTTSTIFKWSQPSNSGSGCDNWSIDNVSISSASSNSFCSITPTSGSIALNDSSAVVVNFKSTGLSEGTYNNTIIINSNDPLYPAKNVNCTLTVNGVPEMALSDTSLYFGSLFHGSSKSDTLLMFNSGCDTLRVTNMISSLSEFSINKTNLKVAPGDTGKVLISFAPESIGSFIGNLTIYNNYADTLLRLTGTGTEPPEISVTPDSLSEELFTGEKSTQLLTISNSGGSDLNFNISFEDAEASAVKSINKRFEMAQKEESINNSESQRNVRGEINISNESKFAAMLYTSSSTSTTGGSIAILGADNGNLKNNEIAQYLIASGRFASVTIINGYTITPTLAELQAFDAVGVFGWSYWINSNAIGDVLADYIDAGGNVFNAFASNGTGGNWMVNGRFNTDKYWLISPYNYVGGSSYSMGVVNEPGHPIMNGVRSVISGSKLQLGVNVAIGATTLAAFTDGTPLIAYNQRDNARRVDISFPFFTSVSDSWGIDLNSDAKLLIINAFEWLTGRGVASWLSADTISGIVPAGSSTDIEVTFDATGLDGGDYDANIVINSNDPEDPEVTVPVNLQVTGIPDISITADTIGFGSLYVGASVTDTLVISNEGTDVLTVNNISSDNEDFTIDSTNFILSPGENQDVLVTFTPDTEGEILGTLTITSDDPDESTVFAALHGEGLIPPEISVSPDSLNAIIRLCNDSLTLPLTIHNIGGSDLTFEIGGTSNNTVELLALTYGVDYDEEYQHTLTAINQYYTDYHLTEINTSSASVLQTALAGKDVLLIAEQEVGSASVFTGFATVLQSFVNNGGTVIFCGTNNSGCVFNTGLFTGSYISFISSGSLNIINTTHPITELVSSPFTASDATFYYSITNANSVRLVGYSNYDIVTYREIGKGKAIYIAFDYYAYSNNAAHIIANAVKWGGAGSLPPWLDLSLISDTISPNSSTVINAKFNSTGLEAGIYIDSLFINSNDPLNSNKKVFCTLTVLNSPVLAMSDTSFQFGKVYNGSSKTDTLLIFNAGCEPLLVSNITSSLPEFTVEMNDISIESGDTSMVYITFTPTSPTLFNGSLIINTNDVDTVLYLSGTGYEPPVINISPESLNASIVECNDSIIQLITINNTGGSDLIFKIENENTNNKLSSTFSAGNGSKGNMFNINTLNTITVNKFDIHLNGTNSYPVEIYYRQGGYEGYETNASAWTLLLSTTVTGRGLNNPTPVTISGLTIPSGETYGIYINSPNGDLKYSNGSNSYSDYNLRLQAGAGLGATFGSVYSPRTWNGSVYYSAKNLPDWLTVSTVSDTIMPGNSTVIDVQFHSQRLSANDYYSNFAITSNDIENPLLSIPVHFLVSTTPYQPSEISGDTIGYTGVTEMYSITNTPGVNYIWVASGDTIDETGNSVNITWYTTGLKTLTVTPSNECGVGLTRTLDVRIVNEPIVPDNFAVADTTVSNGEIVCFNAIDTIIVAGRGNTVEFQSGSSVNLIAGQSILFLPGFHAFQGNYTNASITTTGNFCDGVSSITIVDQPEDKSTVEKSLPEKPVIKTGGKSVKVYPNPNSGQFTLELTNIESGSMVGIYNLLGTRVYQSTAKNETSHKINLPGIKRGIYFVKVMDGKKQVTRKMVVD
jgi:Zn-dependent metalloprotease